MASKQFDVTLLGFQAVDLRSINTGDVVGFRSTSITHNRDLALRHGRTARVRGFGKSRGGSPQVTIQFRDSAQFSMSPINLFPATPEAVESCKQVIGVVEQIEQQCEEQKRPWMATLKLQNILGDAGMYDRLGQDQQVGNNKELEDLPF